MVGVCHEVTAPVVEAALAESVDFLVSYHPLLFAPTTRIVAGANAAGRAYRLLAGGVALGVVHTAFDVASGGAADALAAALQLEDVVPFGPNWGTETVKVVTFLPESGSAAVIAAMDDAGAGTIGAYSGCSFRAAGTGTFFAGPGASPASGTAGVANAEPEVRLEMIAPSHRRDAVVAALVTAHPYEEPAYDVYDVRGNAAFIGRRGRLPAAVPLHRFASEVGAVLGAEPRIAGDRASLVARVAVVPGSGRSFLAHAAGADVIVTGDVGHHDARAAMERGLSVVDPGHAATERPGVARLYAAVAQIAEGVIDLTGVDADPWHG